MSAVKFERHFSGRSNAGLRKAIREAVGGHRCGESNARSVLALTSTVALTEAGRHTLSLVASDYREAGSSFRHSCDCDACYAGNLQRLGAIG